MANLLADGLDWLDDQLKEHASTNVTYRRGANSATIAATFGHQLLKLFDPRGAAKIHRTELDLTFHAADLVLGGSTVTPARGDLVDIVFGSTTKRFEVMPPVGEEHAWRYSDPHQNRIRVHLKSKANP